MTHDKNQSIFSCDEAALWMVQSVRPSVRPSACPSVGHTFFILFPSSHHHEIVSNYYHWQKWCPCKRPRSKVKGNVVKTQFSRLRIVTPVLIPIRRWSDARSLIWHRTGVLLFFRVIRQILRSHGTQNHQFWSELGVPDRNSSSNSQMPTKCCTKLAVA